MNCCRPPKLGLSPFFVSRRPLSMPAVLVASTGDMAIYELRPSDTQNWHSVRGFVPPSTRRLDFVSIPSSHQWRRVRKLGAPSHATIQATTHFCCVGRHLKYITGSLVGLMTGWIWLLPGNIPLLPSNDMKSVMLAFSPVNRIPMWTPLPRMRAGSVMLPAYDAA